MRDLFRRIASRKSRFVAIKKIENRLAHNVLRSFFRTPIVNLTLALFKRRQERRGDLLESSDIGFAQIGFLEEKVSVPGSRPSRIARDTGKM